MIQPARARDSLPLSHPKVALMDLTYHDATASAASLPAGAQRLGQRICDDRAIDLATQELLETTRAACGTSSTARPRSAAATTPSTRST